MPTINKAATQLLLPRDLKTDGQALAIVRQESVAEIWRLCVSAHLPVLQEKYAGVLLELDSAFVRMGIAGQLAREGALQAMIDQKIRFGDLFTADGAPRARFPGKL